MGTLKTRLTKIVQDRPGLGFDALGRDASRLTTVRLDVIEPDPNQPRTHVVPTEEMVESVRRLGVVTPIVVSPLSQDRYRIISGARRYQAALAAGLKTLAVLVRTVADHERLEMQLVENLHREDLTPFEEQRGYQKLQEEFNLTHEEIAKRVSKPRTHVSQILNLRKIPETIREACQNSDTPLSKDTLFLLSKQDTPAKMTEIIQAVKDRVPQAERRELARKGTPRSSPKTKPKRVFVVGDDSVIFQSGNTKPWTLARVRAVLKQLQHKIKP